MTLKLKKMALVIFAGMVMVGCKKEYHPSDAGALVPKTVDEDSSLPAISVNQTRLHAEAFGDPADPMVVFLHGGPGSDYRKSLQVKQLVQDGFYVVFYDQRGSGLSRRHPQDSYNLQLMLDDLEAVIGHYRTSPAQKTFLFGHSWGAILAAAYINAYPAKINGAVLAEPGGFTWESIKAYSKRSRKIRPFSEATNDALYLDQLFTGKENEHNLLDYKLATAASFAHAKGNQEGIEGAFPFWRKGAAVMNGLMKAAEKDGLDVTAQLNNYPVKVLFLYSELNHAYGEQWAQEQSGYFQKKQVEKIFGTGHEMIHFKWNAVYPLVRTYLNALK